MIPGHLLRILCSHGTCVGGYRPVAPATVPEELPLAVFEAFLATNATYNGEAYTGCDDFGTAVVEACEQVGPATLGLIYKLLNSVLKRPGRLTAYS